MRFGQIRKLPSARYQASYPGPDGQRHNGPSTFTHKADAQAWITEERRLIEYGTWTSPAARAEALRKVEQAGAHGVVIGVDDPGLVAAWGTAGAVWSDTSRPSWRCRHCARTGRGPRPRSAGQ